jgi:hypothetical protein
MIPVELVPGIFEEAARKNGIPWPPPIGLLVEVFQGPHAGAAGRVGGSTNYGDVLVRLSAGGKRWIRVEDIRRVDTDTQAASDAASCHLVCVRSLAQSTDEHQIYLELPADTRCVDLPADYDRQQVAALIEDTAAGLVLRYGPGGRHEAPVRPKPLSEVTPGTRCLVDAGPAPALWVLCDVEPPRSRLSC